MASPLLTIASVNFSVFPYLPSFIASLGKSPADVAFYTGLAVSRVEKSWLIDPKESSLLAVEAAVALPVARLSDKWGRRPLFIATLVWLTVTCCSLGTSTSVKGIVMWRLPGETITTIELNASRIECD